MGHQWVFNAPDKQVPPNGRRGTLVVPDAQGWVINRYASDPTSGSLREADTCGRDDS